MNISPLSSFLNNQMQYEKSKVEDTTFQDKLEQAKSSKDDEKLKDSCRQFEAVFMNMLLKNMRNTIQDGGLVEKSNAREMFEGMLDEKMAEEASKGQGIGLAKELYKQLSRNTKTTIDENV